MDQCGVGFVDFVEFVCWVVGDDYLISVWIDCVWVEGFFEVFGVDVDCLVGGGVGICVGECGFLVLVIYIVMCVCQYVVVFVCVVLVEVVWVGILQQVVQVDYFVYYCF